MSSDEQTGQFVSQRGSNWKGSRACLSVLLLVLTGCSGSASEVPIHGYRVIQTYPHDSEAYCQGLLFADGALFESTGLVGRSSVRRVELETGAVQQQVALSGRLFGEGLAMHAGELFQLTWLAGRVNVFDPKTFALLRTMRYGGEGWGLTSDGTHLILSDGSEFLSFRDPRTFREVKRVRVTILGKPVDQLNELEFIEGEVWANRWKYDYLVRIAPDSGVITGSVDLTGLFDNRSIPNGDAVLNGIAYDAETRRVFVTGKLWPKLFEIELAP